MYNLAHLVRVKRHHWQLTPITSKQLRLFFISDIHRRKITPALIKKIEQPIDAVLIGGDLVEGGVPIQRVRKNLQHLQQLGPLFFVWGNNDREMDEFVLRELFKELQVTIIENTSHPMPCHERWGIFGTDDHSSRNVQIDETFSAFDEYDYQVAFCHQPEILTRIHHTYSPSISLAGHTHGGQIRLGRWGLLEVGYEKRTENGYQLVSNGYGTTGVPLRLGALPESHLLIINYE